jgi:hypothetical protein
MPDSHAVMAAEIVRLRESNKELVKALQDCIDWLDGKPGPLNAHCGAEANRPRLLAPFRAALAKARP